MRLLLLALLLTPAFAGEKNDIEYARPGGVPLTLDASIPEGAGPFPAAIVVHGGGWKNGAKRSYEKPILPVLSEAGLAWFTINYRLAPAHQYPAALEDVQAAIRWVKAHAKEYKVDPRRLVLVGESAGGHLAALAALRAGKDTRVAAVIDFYGPHDLVKRETARGEVGVNLKDFLGISSLDAAGLAKLKEASPSEYVKAGAPPFLIIHGTEDAAVPFDQAGLLCDKLKAVKTACEVFPVQGAPHGVGPWEGHPEWLGYKTKIPGWVKATLK